MGCTSSKDVVTMEPVEKVPVTGKFQQKAKKLYILHIVVSPMGDKSYSRGLGEVFIETVKNTNKLVEVVTRDLDAEKLQHLDTETLTAGYVPKENRSPEMQAKHQLRLDLIKEITDAMAVVISTPMYNWFVPSVLKAYIDQIVMPGVLDPQQNKGLAGKPVTVLIACGGSYSPGSWHPEWDFCTGYLKMVFQNLGATNVESIAAEYTLAGVMPGMETLVEAKEKSFAEAKVAAQKRAETMFQEHPEISAKLQAAAASASTTTSAAVATTTAAADSAADAASGAADSAEATVDQTVDTAKDTTAEASAEASAAVTAATTVPTSTSSAPAMKKGYILKQGHVVKNWKNRFFVLDEGKLIYYENPSPNPPYGTNKKGEFALKGMTVTVDNQHVNLTGANKDDSNLLLEIRYPTERQEWVDALNAHIAYYSA